ncbi:MAG TPA: tetratricopeptide repeat protein [Tepidisphaeraceae bacterium]
MSSRTANASYSASQLWQLPLLLVSLGLFGYAAYLLWDPQPGPTVEERIVDVRTLLKAERPEAAVERLKALLSLDALTPPQRGRMHLLMAEALDSFQTLRKQIIPVLQHRIIEQTRLAGTLGVQPGGADYRRLGGAYERVAKPVEAVDAYQKSIALDPDKSLVLARKIIDLLLDTDQTAAADRALAEYTQQPSLTDAERCWALGERAELLIDAKQFVDARVLLDQALKLSADPVQEGEINYRLGYASYHLGDSQQAERFLRAARDQLKIRHPLDAEACVLLGKISQARGEAEAAISFFEIVLTSHPDAKIAVLAKLGRGVCRAMLKQDDPAMIDLQQATKNVDERAGYARYEDDVLTGLRQAAELLAGRENFAAAIELLDAEQTLAAEPMPEFFARVSRLMAARADQLDKSLAGLTPAERIKREQQARDLRTRAGDAIIAYGYKQTLSDDKQYGESLWRGIELYEKAVNTPAVVAALELFVAERPEDALAPEALLRLGRTYQANGQLDKAVAVYQRNQFRYPKSLAASKTAVPLAQALIERGPDSYAKAESVLVGVLDNNAMFDPTSLDFQTALFELGQLYSRMQRHEEAIVRMEEFAKRYPTDDRVGRLTFLMADGYRKSAQSLGAQFVVASAEKKPGVDLEELRIAHHGRLTKAKALYDRVVERYRESPPARDPDKLYHRLSYFYRADCVYDLGDYQQAIALYDNAAFRFQDDPSALAAYVQIVNAWCRLGKTAEAKVANERAKWLLRRMPADAFANGTFSMPKDYWEQWLKWSNEAGMW